MIKPDILTRISKNFMAGVRMIYSQRVLIIDDYRPTYVGPLALTNDKIYGLSNVNGPASGPL